MNATAKKDTVYQRRLLGMAGFGAADSNAIETTIETAAACTGLTESQVEECLIENPYNCPEGFYADFISHFCELPPKFQTAMLNQTMRIMDFTHVIRLSLGAGTIGTSLDLIKTTTKRADGIFTFEDAGMIATDQAFCFSAIQIRYAEIALPVGALPADFAAQLRYGIIRSTNTVPAAAAVTDSFVAVPQSLVNSDYTLEIGGKKVMIKMPLVQMNNFNKDNASIGYKKVDSHFLAKPDARLNLKVDFATTLVPLTAGNTGFIEFLFHGAGLFLN